MVNYTDSGIHFRDGDNLKVRLKEQGTNGRRVVFQTAPEISETRAVNYKQHDPIHAPGSIFSFVNSGSRAYNLSGIKLISRSREEATRNLARLNLIRSWAVPVFGQGSFEGNNQQDVLGAPPKILELSAYASDIKRGNIYKVPTVLVNVSIQYPTDVDYIPTALVDGIDTIVAGVPFPTIMIIDLQLSETHSPVKYQKFNINDFRNGKLTGF